VSGGGAVAEGTVKYTKQYRAVLELTPNDQRFLFISNLLRLACSKAGFNNLISIQHSELGSEKSNGMVRSRESESATLPQKQPPIYLEPVVIFNIAYQSSKLMHTLKNSTNHDAG